MPQSRPTRPAPTRRHQPAPPEVVDPRWLFKALGLCFVAALICGYATLCLLFYQGSWQLVLHPKSTVERTPAAVGLAFSAVHFDSTETGQPRLTGWWIPAAVSKHDNETILYLHSGAGSLADTVPALALLHQTGLNLFAIDYRGFGASDSSEHPSAERMTQDASAALNYLTATRHLPAASIVPAGSGVGASLAAALAVAHPELPAVILDNPDPDPAATALAARPHDPVPVRLLFGDQFEIAKSLSNLSTPKLLIDGGPISPAYLAEQPLFDRAASPRITVTLPSGTDDAQLLESIGRFLDQYLVPGQAPAGARQ